MINTNSTCCGIFVQLRLIEPGSSQGVQVQGDCGPSAGREEK